MRKQRKGELARLDDAIVGLRDKGENTVRKMAVYLAVDKKTAHRYLKFMTRHGWASVVGEGRSAYHVYNQCSHCRQAL